MQDRASSRIRAKHETLKKVHSDLRFSDPCFPNRALIDGFQIDETCCPVRYIEQNVFRCYRHRIIAGKQRVNRLLNK